MAIDLRKKLRRKRKKGLKYKTKKKYFCYYCGEVFRIYLDKKDHKKQFPNGTCESRFDDLDDKNAEKERFIY